MLTALVLFALSLQVAGHGYLSSPPPRGIQKASYAIDDLKSPNKKGMCRGEPQGQITSVTPGQSLTLGLTITAPHVGPCQVTVLDADLTNESAPFAQMNNCAAPGNTGSWTITLPTGLSGHKVLRWQWLGEHVSPPEEYEQCIDVDFGGGSGGSSAPAPAPPTTGGAAPATAGPSAPVTGASPPAPAPAPSAGSTAPVTGAPAPPAGVQSATGAPLDTGAQSAAGAPTDDSDDNTQSNSDASNPTYGGAKSKKSKKPKKPKKNGGGAADYSNGSGTACAADNYTSGNIGTTGGSAYPSGAGAATGTTYGTSTTGGASTTGGSSAAGGSCTNGSYTCLSTKEFGICNFGQYVKMQCAPGTSCNSTGSSATCA